MPYFDAAEGELISFDKRHSAVLTFFVTYVGATEQNVDDAFVFPSY